LNSPNSTSADPMTTPGADLTTTTDLGCRSLFRVQADPHLSGRVHEQLYAWSKQKGWDADRIGGQGVVDVADGVTASLVQQERQDGSVVERWRFREDSGHGIWITQLTTLVDRDHSGWVWTDVLSPGGQTPGVPRLVRNILQVTDGLDGSCRLTAEPYRATTDDVGYIHSAIVDPDRRGFLFVAGADDNVNIPQADWLGFVSKLLSGTRGIASAYVLDPASTLALNSRLPASHRVGEWSVRTFAPNPQLDDPRDAVRHRILTTSRIVGDSQSRLRGLLQRSAVRHSVSTPLPRDLVRIDRHLRQLLDDTIVEQAEVTASPAAARTPAEPENSAVSLAEMPSGVIAAIRSAVTSVLGTAEVTVETVARLGSLASEAIRGNNSLSLIRTRLRTLEDERNSLEDQKVEFEQRAQDGQVELAAARIDLVDAERQLRHYRSELAKLDRAGTAAWVPESNPADEPPLTFGELLERMQELERIDFTGDEKDALELDEHGLLDWPLRTWNSLRGLNDYCRVRCSGEFEGSVDDYIDNVPAGCTEITPGSHASGETRATQNHPVFGPARVLPVPRLVNPDGKLFMGAHIRIAKYGSISPRMHYYNDATGTGRIYIGYIGRHLPNFRTT
jgi:hypothetical protein